MANGKIETYDEAARVIALYLEEFCDFENGTNYCDIIAQASRKAAETIDLLRQEVRDQDYQIFHLSANQKD